MERFGVWTVRIKCRIAICGDRYAENVHNESVYARTTLARGASSCCSTQTVGNILLLQRTSACMTNDRLH